MPAAPKIEIRIPKDLGLTRKQAKELEAHFQSQLADVLKGEVAAVKSRSIIIDSPQRKLAARAKSKTEVV